MTDFPKPPFENQRPLTPPGRDADMDPRPDYGEAHYKGSGRLSGRKAIITGADSGIGRAVALAYAREGADVLVSYYDEHVDADETCRLVESAGRKAVRMAGDVKDPRHCRAIVETAVSEFGQVDILVNNAAHQKTFASPEEISDEEWEITFATNIHAMFYLVKAALPHMKPGSSIINTTSVNADTPSPQLLAYATTKGAIQNFTGGLAQMLAERDIRGELCGSGSDLDAAHPRHHAAGEGEELRIAGADEASGTALRTRPRLCDAGRLGSELRLRRHRRGDRRQADHLRGTRSRMDRTSEAAPNAARRALPSARPTKDPCRHRGGSRRLRRAACIPASVDETAAGSCCLPLTVNIRINTVQASR